MTIDVIIVADSRNSRLRRITTTAIRTLLASDDVIKFNIVVVEGNKSVSHANVTTLHYDFPFNYNKCLNYGLSHTSNEIVMVCNNDLVFTGGFMRGILMAMKMGYDSVSPISPGCDWHKNFDTGNYVVDGYDIGKHIAGWCIATTRNVIRKIGGFDESVDFWYSDNLYARQLKTNGFKHCLACNSLVYHVQSSTLKTLPKSKLVHYTQGQLESYQEGLKKYETQRNNKQLQQTKDVEAGCDVGCEKRCREGDICV